MTAPSSRPTITSSSGSHSLWEFTGIRAGAAASAKSGAGISMLKTPRLKARRPRRFAATSIISVMKPHTRVPAPAMALVVPAPVSLHPDMLGRGARRPGFDDDGGHRGHGCLDIMARRPGPFEAAPNPMTGNPIIAALGGGGACSTIAAGIGRSTMSVSARAIPAQTAATTSAQAQGSR